MSLNRKPILVKLNSDELIINVVDGSFKISLFERLSSRILKEEV